MLQLPIFSARYIAFSSTPDRQCRPGTKYLFRIVILFSAGHVLGQAKDLEVLSDGQLDDLLERVLCMAGAELPRVAVVGKGHDSLGLFRRAHAVDTVS
jgi:hypothetical protein